MAFVLTNSSTDTYHRSVVEMERRATDFSYVQYRIAPYFLPVEAVKHVANERFGAGHPLRDRYIKAQADRHAAFMQLMARDAVVREIYPRDRLMSYVESGTHAGNMWPLTPELMRQLVLAWRTAIAQFPNYCVAIADESVPMKYHVIDQKAVILHEPIGRGDSHRLNSIFILDDAVGKTFAEDFDLVWGLIDPKWRDAAQVCQWIDEVLIPLSATRDRKSKPPRDRRSSRNP